MRVAMVDPSLFTLQYDASLARALSGAGCDVTLHTRKLQPTDGMARGVDMSAQFYRLAETAWVRGLPKPARLAVKAIDHVASMRRLWRHLLAARPDVIHFQWLPLPLLDGKLLKSFRQLAPLVLTVHDTDPFNGDPAARLQRLGVKQALEGFGRLIVHTRQGQARLMAQGLPETRLTVLPHGIPELLAPEPDPMQGELTVLLFGKIKPYKGADLLIDAFAALPPALRGQARLRIVGKPYMDLGPLQAQAAASGAADRISIEPVFVADQDLPQLLGPGTIMVFPYREIEASGVLYQAVEYGRPIIASRMGAFAEVLQDGVHGRLVQPGDAPALTEAMASLLGNRAAAAQSAAAVRNLAGSGWSWDDVARGTISVYHSARQAA
jgi:glycosyltransferase involved in cell wall biosynthesis